MITVVALLVGLSVSIPSLATPEAEGEPFLVFDTASSANPVGTFVVNDYGFMRLVLASPEAAQAMEADGVTIVPVDYSVGRGAYIADWSDVGENSIPAELRADDSRHRIVQFHGPISLAWVEAIKAKGIVVRDYVPEFALLGTGSLAQWAEVESLPFVRYVIAYHPAFKLSSELPETPFGRVVVYGYRDANVDTLRAEIESTGAVVAEAATTGLDHVFDLIVPTADFSALAGIEAVHWIGPPPGSGTMDNDEAAAIVQSGTKTSYPLTTAAINGSTQKVSICDSGLWSELNQSSPVVIKLKHASFEDPSDGRIEYNAHLASSPLSLPRHRKVDLYYSPQEQTNKGDYLDATGHGTKATNILAGGNLTAGRDGVDSGSFAARIAFCDIQDPSVTNSLEGVYILHDYANYWDPARVNGSRIHSDSWGQTTLTGVYTATARQIDAYVWANRDFTIFRSTGNHNLTGAMRPEAVSKNVVAVGASENKYVAATPLKPHGSSGNIEKIWGWSNEGPASDSRIKPNVVAPGACVSTAEIVPPYYTCTSGTSFSTPQVASGGALIRDYLAKGYYPGGAANATNGVGASSALIRGMLQISAKRLNLDGGSAQLPAFPNGAAGWGRILLDDVLYFSGDTRKLLISDEQTALSTGQTATYSVSVAAGQRLRIMLTWTDFPALAEAPVALVNNLDLFVTGPGVPAPTYRGNAFSNGESVPFAGVPDTANVDEAVYIAAPTAGTYTIEVRGTNVPSGPQPFALVVTGGVGWV